MSKHRQRVLLASDALLALLDSSVSSHTQVVSHLMAVNKEGLDPSYPYPAFLEVYNKAVNTEDIERRTKLYKAFITIVQSPLIVIPTHDDLEVASGLFEYALENNKSVSFTDMTIVAMAIGSYYRVITFNKDLSSFIESVSTGTLSEVESQADQVRLDRRLKV